MATTTQYSNLSHQLTKTLDKTEKKENGIYFTPPSVIEHALSFLDPHIAHVKTALEPSCGSCEFATRLLAKYPQVHITGIELNETIYRSIHPLSCERFNLIHTDFLKYTPSSPQKYDLIIGNPPYFVMKKTSVPSSYYPYFEGRPNIFILFIIKSLQLLNPRGILCFVLPQSFLNCLYYDKTRKYIADKFRILGIWNAEGDYLETKQDTIVLVVQNIAPAGDTANCNREFILEIGTYTVFGNPGDIARLSSCYAGSTTLANMGCQVSVGNVVWNQCVSLLTDDATQTRLIYSSDISNGQLGCKIYTNEKKKNYIRKKGEREPVLVINRGYGVGNYQFQYCVIDVDYDYLVENHLIVIRSPTNSTREQTLEIYKKIIRSFQDPRTEAFIQLYFGNNAINTTELNCVLPIYEA